MNNKNRLSDFSSLSVICSVDKFVKTVDAMNETIMVPSRLLNVEVDAQGNNVPELLRGSSDAYTFFSVLNSVKNSIVWGLSRNEDESPPEEKSVNENTAWMMPQETQNTKELEKGHTRRISAVSMGSIMSSTSSGSSETESERLSEAGDSGVDGEEVEPIEEVTTSVKKHLKGLERCLSRLTETALYLTDRYQEEVSV